MPTVASGANLRDREGYAEVAINYNDSAPYLRRELRDSCSDGRLSLIWKSRREADDLVGPIATIMIASLIERIDSAKSEKGESTTLQNTLESRATVLSPDVLAGSCLRLNWDVFSNGTTAMHGICSSD